ncbi:MAG: hypothetical protein IJ131_05270 [Eggerthellaceae bacterium]|nr:hypothetical protein [Eggerthellaceae bacterium]
MSGLTLLSSYSSFDLMMEMMLDFFLFIFVAAVVVFIIQRIRKSSAKTNATASQQTQKPANASQIVEDIKMTQTTSTTDAVNILDDLGAASPGYRHYCELVGTSQTSGGVVAPYSKREVAYYDLRCYRIESREGRDVETLIAHEKSIDPFYFTDPSGEQRIFVDLESFENHVILVNSTNRVEGANSEVSQALNNAMSQHGAGSSPRVSFSARALDAAQTGANWLAGATEWTRRGLAQAALQAQGLMQPFAGLQPAFAGAAVCGTDACSQRADSREKGTAMFSRPDDSGPIRMKRGRGGFSVGFGSYPPGLDSFLGGALSGGHMGGYGGPYVWGGGRVGGSSVTETLLSVGLGMLLSSINTTKPQTGYAPVNQPPRDSFRGYRIIEDVVPLGSPIYGLGEIYRTGSDVHIGKSVSTSYPSSYFACKHEAEVIEHLSK